MPAVEVIERPAAAAVALDPIRARLLAELATPGSASTLASKVGLARQKVNYHLRTLESHGLVRLVEERQRRGLVERIVVATAGSYVVSPAALGEAATDPSRTPDKLSADYLIALAARAIREVGILMRRANASGKRLATLSIDAEVRFRSPADRADFTAELASAVTTLVARYHDGSAPNGRTFRLMVGAHPLPVPESAEPVREEHV